MKALALVTLCLCSLASLAQTTRTYKVIMRTTSQATMWDGAVIDIFGFASTLAGDATLPGKTLYCEEGDTVILDALNFSQGAEHTIHLHGLDVDTRNDGDPATSFALSHLEDTTYTFVATHAGTYTYHCHVADVVHVQMGMYGLIVVKAAGGAKTAWTGGPAFSKDYKWLTSEVDKSWHDTIPVEDMMMDTVHLPPYEPDYFLINGKSEHELAQNDSIKIRGQQNEPIYLRLANIGFFNNRVVFPSWLNAKVIDTDGRPLPVAVTKDTVDVMPGERYGVMLTPSAQQSGFVQVQFQDMNTGLTWNTQEVPVDVEGFFAVDDVHRNAMRLRAFPNPASSHVTFSHNAPAAGACTLEVFNVLGALVSAHPWNAGATSLTVSTDGLVNGAYRCRLSNARNETLAMQTVSVLR